MPILAAGPIGVVTPELPDIPTPHYVEDVGTLTASWVDPTGRVWPLSNTAEDLGWFTTHGPAGWGASPVEIVTDERARGGVQPRFVRRMERRLQWPLYIWGETHLQFTHRYRMLMRAFTMTSQRGAPGWIRIIRPDGDVRQIACYYEDGFAGEAGENQVFAKPVLQLLCPDGFFSAQHAAEPVRRIFSSGGSFFDPFLSVASSKVLAGDDSDPPQEVLNIGDTDAWPVWTITGPMTKLTGINETLGARFSLTYPLTLGQQVTITTDPATVRGPGDLNLSRYIDWFDATGGYLWPLTDGENLISFRVDGAGAGTSVQLDYTPRFETA